MKKLKLLINKKLRAVPLPAWSLGTGAVLIVLLGLSCSTVNRSVVVLPNYPGAKYIGSKECEQCHEKIYRDFATADHARLIAEGPNALNAGCESCDGPCRVHSDSGGETKPTYSSTSRRPQSTSYGARVAVDPPLSVDTMCFQCHSDVRGQFGLPSHHPVPE